MLGSLLVPGTPLREILQAQEEYSESGAAPYRTGALTEQRLLDGRWVLISERRTRDGGIVGIDFAVVVFIENVVIQRINHLAGRNALGVIPVHSVVDRW